MAKAVIIMGSKGDLEWCQKIADALDNYGIESVLRIASAHKVPLKAYELIKRYEKEGVVFITVAGRSNALSGFSDAQTVCPVIACPPYSGNFGGADIYSSLRMPSGVAPLVVLEPENAALATAKIFALTDENIRQKIRDAQENNRSVLEKADSDLKNS